MIMMHTPGHSVNFEMNDMEQNGRSVADPRSATFETPKLQSSSTVNRILKHIFCMKAMDMLAIVVVICLSILRLFCFVVFAAFDMACFAYDKTSLTNCTQKVLLSSPLPFLYAWLVVANLMSAAVLIGLSYNLPGVIFHGFKSSFKKLLGKQAFWSLNINLCVVLLGIYVIRLVREGTAWKAFIVGIASLKIFNLLLIYTLNFVHPLQLPRKLTKAVFIVPFLFYWSTLVSHSLENFFLFISNSLDVMESISPLGNSSSEDHRVLIVLSSLSLSANVAFHLRSFAFFWPKLFHGDRDFFSGETTLSDIPTVNSS